MDIDEKLKFCRNCKLRGFDKRYGTVCGLTNHKPRFENECPDYKFDATKIEFKKNTKKTLKTAGGWVRFANLLIDGIILQFVSTGIIYLLIFLNVEFIFYMNTLGDILFTIVINVSYYSLLESNFQITIGKLVTGTIVVDEKGKKPTIGAIIGRSFSRHIPFDAFSYLGEKTIGWHDSISKTRVIKKTLAGTYAEISNDILDVGFDDLEEIDLLEN